MVGDTLLVVQKTFSGPGQTVIMAPGLNIGEVIRESSWSGGEGSCTTMAALSEFSRSEGGRSQMRGSRGGRDDVWGKWLETFEPEGQSDPDITSCGASHRGGARGNALVSHFRKFIFCH